MSFQRSIAFLLLGLTAATGQEPVTPPGVPVPGVVPPPAAGVPSANPAASLPPTQAGVPLAEQKVTADINEPKLSGNALAGFYRKFTGRRVIVSAAAATAEFAFVQEASPQDPLTFAQAADLLRMAATIENFIFVPHPNNPDVDILTLATGGIRPPAIGLQVYNENDTLPEGDAVISYVMTLSNIKPGEAVNTFTQIIGQFGAYGSIAAVPNASAIVITENTSLIRKLIDLKKEIDKPSSQVASRFIKVQYADVTEIATTLTELLTAQQSTQTTAGIQRVNNAAPAPGGAPAVAGGAGAGDGGGSSEATPVQIVPDPRTNRIFAMGRPMDLVFVEGLVREFDIETSEKNFLRRKLRFLTVSEFLPIAGDALTRAFSGTGDSGGAGAQGGAGGGAQGGNRSNTQANSRQQSGGQSSARNSGSTGANFGGGGGGAGSSSSAGGSSGGSSLSDPNVSSAPESVLVGRTLLVADNITNSIVVQGPPSGLEIIERLLDQIDVKPDQVMISTVIGQLTLNDNFNFGMDYLVLGNGDFATRGGGGGGPVLPILNQLIKGDTGVGEVGDPGYVAPVADQNPFNPGSLSSSSGLKVYGKIGNNLNVYLNALQQKTDFTVLSRPSIFTSNNQKGTISSGEKIAIPTSSNSYGSSGNSSTNIEYQNVVLKLEVIPQVNVDNEITMNIALLSDEQNGTQTIAGGGGDGGDLTVPRISTREIVTKVTVPNAETIVLGGLIVAKDTKDRSGIPILSSIPYLGSLFGSTTNNKDRTELMVFMQPSVVNNERSLSNVQTEMDERYKVSKRTRDFADGPGVLPPPDAITPVDDKASNLHPAAVVGEPAPVVIKKKTPPRPIHRR
jgi:general secretion pathway protein D